MEASALTLISGDVRGVGRAIELSKARMRNIRQNLFWAFAYNVVLIPVAAGALYPFFGEAGLLNPVGEVLGMMIGSALGWGTVATIVLAIVLAFFFGYGLTMLPLLRSGMALGAVLPLAFASDTLSITVMEIVDNLIIVVIPGAMDAGLGSLLFWGSLAFALAVAFVAAFPVNRYLISRGKGHAVIHEHHGH
jgi:hypothetical protein